MLEALQSKRNGFTLLELVVVVVVVAILALLIIPNLLSGPARARDAQRKADLRNIKTSLESYYNDNGFYPNSLSQLEGGAVPYIKQVPTDPKTKQPYKYTPIGNPPLEFTLQATLENKSDKDIKQGTTNIYELTNSSQ